MKLIRLIIACTAAGVVLSACTQGATGPPSITSVNPIANSKLELVVGTANIAGVATAGLNVVSTLRQPNGDSAVLADTPTITGPFAFSGVTATPAPAGGEFGCTAAPCGPGGDLYSTEQNGAPSIQEVAAGATISGTPQTVRPGTPTCDSAMPLPPSLPSPPFAQCPSGLSPNTTTLGQGGGAFGMGIAPYNSNNSGTATSIEPYASPIFDTTGNAYQPWGGPPAFDPNHDNMGVRDGLFSICGDPSTGCASGLLLGVAQGITVFENVTPSAGTYTLSVVIPTSPTSSGRITATAMLASTATLPAVPAPTVTEDLNGDGGAAITGSLPSPITEGYVEIIDFGNGGNTCQGPLGTETAPVYYTIHISGAGAYAVALPPMDGPNTNVTGGFNLAPSMSICTAAANGGTGDSYSAYAVGFDYPLFAASYPSNHKQAPALAGANGQADISISAPTSGTFTFAKTRRPMHESFKTLYTRLRHPKWPRIR